MIYNIAPIECVNAWTSTVYVVNNSPRAVWYMDQLKPGLNHLS